MELGNSKAFTSTEVDELKRAHEVEVGELKERLSNSEAAVVSCEYRMQNAQAEVEELRTHSSMYFEKMQQGAEYVQFLRRESASSIEALSAQVKSLEAERDELGELLKSVQQERDTAIGRVADATSRMAVAEKELEALLSKQHQSLELAATNTYAVKQIEAMKTQI